MSDHEETAKRLIEQRKYCNAFPRHNSRVVCYECFVSEVAAALAQAEAKGAEKVIGASLECADTQDAEIARLKAENLRLSHEGLLVEKQAAEGERDYFRARLIDTKRERDAAEAKGVRTGLQRAREIATGFSKPYEIDWWMTKTKKEI